jgi:asparagine synthase (glutamine-hydrolysing)
VCGLCGEIRFDSNSRVISEHVLAMRDALVHRGPDAAGIFMSTDERVGLGFRRLSIIDVSSNANQPMPNEDATVQLMLNGEIYNFQDLRKRLISQGHQFRSNSDAEVVVHLYEEKGIECVDEIDGMFALAIWDQRERRLMLARDRAGKKPLFYIHKNAHIAFASEIKGLLAHPALSIEMDRQAIPYFFLHGYVPCPNSFYRDVYQVRPGECVVVDERGVTQRTFWDLGDYKMETSRQTKQQSFEVATGEVRRLVTQAVERRLMSDVPLGAFLSGGIDSTVVVGLMNKLMGQRVKTFSIGFKGDPSFDETAFARLVATRFNTDHTEFIVSPSAIDLMDTLIWHHDGPFGDSSAIPTYIVSKLTREHVTVVLTGDGGDELFAGYRRFRAAVLAEQMPGLMLSTARLLLQPVNWVGTDNRWLAYARRFVDAASLPLYDRITRWSGLFYDELEDMLQPDLLASLRPINRLFYLDQELPKMAKLTPLGKVLHANYKTYLLDDLLVKTDRCTMSNSLEARAPFLDQELVEYVTMLPDALKLDRGRYKVVLREAFQDLLPTAVQQRGKMGFGVPLDAWFRNDLQKFVNEMLLPSDARYREYVRPTFVHDLVRRHQTGQINAGLRLWSLVTFERWLQMLPLWNKTGAVTAGVA